MRSIAIRIAGCMILLLSFLSCRKEKSTYWDVDLAVPIARSTLNLNNFLQDSLFQPDANGVLHLVYSRELVSYALDSLVKIPDTSLTYTYLWPIGYITVNSGQTLFSGSQDIDFDVSNVLLKKSTVRQGMLKVEFSSTVHQPTVIQYTLPGTSLWGNVFSIQEPIAAGSTAAPATVTKYYSLNGYNIDMTGSNHAKTNSIAQAYTISIAQNAVSDTVHAGEGVTMRVSYQDMVPDYIEGYFGQHIFSVGPDTTNLSFLKNVKVSNLALQDASISFRIVNELGVDISGNLNSIKSINTAKSNTVTLNAPSLYSTVNINRAGKTSGMSIPVFPTVKTLSVTGTNSNIVPFLENLPDKLGYGVNINVNPLGNISGGNDFAYYGYGCTIYADMDVPVAFSADYFQLVNTSPLDLTQVTALNNVNYADLVLRANNGYPFDAVLQGYMLNAQGHVVDSLFTNSLHTIASGVVDNNNIVTQTTASKLVATFDAARVQRLRQCKSIKFVSTFYLPNQPSIVKLLDTYSMDLVLSMDLNYSVNK